MTKISCFKKEHKFFKEPEKIDQKAEMFKEGDIIFMRERAYRKCKNCLFREAVVRGAAARLNEKEKHEHIVATSWFRRTFKDKSLIRKIKKALEELKNS